jgi:hypothetical protein
MNVENPFLFITPRKGKDKLVGRFDFLKKVKKTVINSLKKQSIVTLNGDFGIGKSLFVKKTVKELNKRKSIKIYRFDFNFNLLNELRNLPSEKRIKKEIVVVIDRFELILSLSSFLQDKILQIMTDLCKAEITIIVTTSSDLLEKIKDMKPKIKNYFKVLEVPSMNFEETQKLIISRLNEVRPKKSNSIEPFTKYEIKEIYKKSKGNPRMILMLCAALFEEKFE